MAVYKMHLGKTIRAWFDSSNRTALEEQGLAASPVPVTPYSAGGLDPNAAVPFYAPKPVAPPAQDIDSKRAAQKKANADQTALGLSGTANLMGFIQDIGEYKAELRGLQAMQIYEKMRRSNATVAALESAIRLPIRAADWQVRPGVEENEPGYALAKEIAKAAEENLFGGLESRTESGAAHTQTFESVIENALLAPIFGCSSHEDLWAIDADKNRVRLRGLAPRLPLTFYQFLVEPDGETLKTLIQFGYRGALVQIVPVPAEKLALFTVNREGAYFYGRSILRAAYLHWYFNSQLYRIDAIACERNGMALPWIEQGPNALPDDVSQSWQWVQNLTTNERSGISTPNGWKFSLVSPSGRPRDISTSIQHHNEQIMEAGLAGFLLLGRTQSGSRALGDTKLDFFLLSEEALARMIGDIITTTTLRRWCDLNYEFPAGKTAPYPRLTCGRIVVVNISDLVAAIKELSLNTIGALETSEERDNYLAERLGYPPISGAPRPKFAPIVRQIREIEQGDEAVPDEGSAKSFSDSAALLYSPDQARDERGQWTDGGGAEGAHAGEWKQLEGETKRYGDRADDVTFEHGGIERETDKAVLVKVPYMIGAAREPTHIATWLPKSQISNPEKGKVRTPYWLMGKKSEEVSLRMPNAPHVSVNGRTDDGSLHF